MIKLMLSVAFTIFVSLLVAQNYTPTDIGSEVAFSIKNFGVGVDGSFKGLKGKISFNPANLPATSLSVSVDVATVNTGNGSRDNHLKKSAYFDVDKYPLMSFVSSRITNAAKAGTLLVEGKITIRGVTKLLSFPFTVTPKSGGYLFEGKFKLNRRDFGVGGKSLVMSDNLDVSLSVFAKKNE